jgi:hypothetical protein
MSAYDLHFAPSNILVTVESPLYRPPSFPPPDDWVVSVDREGAALSLYGDDFWDYRAFERSATFNFGKDNMSAKNKLLVKQIIHLMIYHHRLFPGRIQSCTGAFSWLVTIAKVCDSKGVLMSSISRFPAIHQELADALQCDSYQIIVSFLHRLRLYADILGFEIFDVKGMAFLVSQQGVRDPIQTPYIPPRIWTYQVNRLSECLDDFLEHQEALEKAFARVAEAYKQNASALPDLPNLHSPFHDYGCSKSVRTLIPGGFGVFLVEYGLSDVLDKWMGQPNEKLRLSRLTAYLNMVREASIFYILNFSLQRINEGASLRSDCLLIEHDDRLGDVNMVTGETTKTDPDSDARWVVPASVKRAVDVASSIARLRLQHFPSTKGAPVGDDSAPLMLAPTEPWTDSGNYRNSKDELVSQIRFGPFLSRFPKFLDSDVLTVTEEDWKIAVSMTPNITSKPGFGIGLPWRFTAHQLRRTTAVNMFASNMVSDSSLQWLMKHLIPKMTLFYGRNYTNLRLDSNAETVVIIESYKAIYRQLVSVVEDSIGNVRPHSREMIPISVVNLVDADEEAKLTKLIKKGDVGCRRTLAGLCMKGGACEYGGIESIAQCAGADGGGICADAIFKRDNEAGLIRLKAAYEKEIETLSPDMPRFGALKKEIYAIEVYINVINDKKIG